MQRSTPGPEPIATAGCSGARLDPNTCQIECQTECQIECQTECQNICQIECQKDCQIECQNICQNRCQIECQTRCQIECQIESQNIHIYIYICYIYVRMVCQELCQDSVSGWGSLEESIVFSYHEQPSCCSASRWLSARSLPCR